MNKKVIVGVAVVAGVLLAGGVVLAAPAISAPRSTPASVVRANSQEAEITAATTATATATASKAAIVRGMVVSVSGNTIKLDVNVPKVKVRQVNVQTTNGTTFFVQGVASPTINDIKTDDMVAVLVQRPVTKTLTALSVAVLPVPDKAILLGTISNLTNASFTLTNQNKRNLGTVSINDTTKVIVPGKSGSTASDLKDGDSVIVYGKPTGTKSLTADLIVVRPINKANTFSGLVVSLSDNALVIWTPAGEQLSVDATNAFVFVANTPNANLSSIRVGQSITIIGTRSGDKVTAQLVTNASLARIKAAKAGSRIVDDSTDDGGSI